MSAAHSDNVDKNVQELLSDLDGTTSCMALLVDDVGKSTGSSGNRGQPTNTMVTDCEMIEGIMFLLR